MEQENTRTRRGVTALRRTATLAVSMVAAVVLPATAALATSYTDAASVITPAGTQLKTELLAVAGGVAVLGVVILAVRKGWGLMKRFF